jgi:phosphoribosylformylglycinamidine cyclo-ligase
VQQRGQIESDEMLRVFNMGVGMVAVVAATDAARFQALLSEESWVIGDLVPGEQKVVLA